MSSRGSRRRSNGRKAAGTLADLRRRHILEQEGLNTWGIWNFSHWPLLAGHLKKGFEYAKQRYTAYPRYVVQRKLLPDFLATYHDVIASLQFSNTFAVASADDPLPSPTVIGRCSVIFRTVRSIH